MQKFKVEISDQFEARGYTAAARTLLTSLRDTSVEKNYEWRVRVTNIETDDSYDIYFSREGNVIDKQPVDPMDF